MIARSLLAILLVSTLLASCSGAPLPFQGTPTPTATPTITPLPPFPVPVDTQDLRQTVREVGGGNFIHMFGGVTSALDPISTRNIDTLQPTVIRTHIALAEWEPVEGQTGAGRFQMGEHIGPAFAFLQEIKRRNPDAILIASLWDIPNWMVSNPEAENARVIPPERYDAVIDSIAHWLKTAQEEYGAPVDYVSFNEATIGIDILFAPEEYAAFIRQAGPRFAEMGLKTRWLLGDAHNIASAERYAATIYAAEDIRPYLGPLTFHSWDFQVPDSILQSLGRYASENGLEVWCTEAGWDPSQWHRPEEFRTWKHAMNLATIYTRVLRDSRATTMLYWEMMGGDYAINDGSRPFPALLYIDQLQVHFPVGAQIVGTPDDEIATLSVLSLAARLPEGGFSVQVINKVKARRTVQITGLPDGAYLVTRISETAGVEPGSTVNTSAGSLLLELPEQTITFLSLRGAR